MRPLADFSCHGAGTIVLYEMKIIKKNYNQTNMQNKIKSILILAFLTASIGCQTTPNPNEYVRLDTLKNLLETQKATEGLTASEFDSGWNQALLNIQHSIDLNEPLSSIQSFQSSNQP